MDSEHNSAKKIEEGDRTTNSARVRKGWTESFQLMAINKDDELLIKADLPTEYDEEWEWK